MYSNYVALAKGTDPYVSPELAEEMALRYAKLREDAVSDPNEGHITARMLLAMLRLSTALARLRFSDEVVMDDFEEALRLMDSCKVRPSLMSRRYRACSLAVLAVLAHLLCLLTCCSCSLAVLW